MVDYSLPCVAKRNPPFFHISFARNFVTVPTKVINIAIIVNNADECKDSFDHLQVMAVMKTIFKYLVLPVCMFITDAFEFKLNWS